MDSESYATLLNYQMSWYIKKRTDDVIMLSVYTDAFQKKPNFWHQIAINIAPTNLFYESNFCPTHKNFCVSDQCKLIS